MSVIIDGTLGITTPPVALLGSTSGSISLVAPAVAGSNTQTLVAATGTLAPLISGTAVASTSGTSIDFTSIPSWAKRVTVMFSGVSTSGSSIIQVQIGSGSVTTSGYTGAAVSNTTIASYTAGIATGATGASGYLRNGALIITNLSGNIYTALGNFGDSVNTVMSSTASSVTLGGILDRVRITTVNGTDTFDAGSINILYE